MHFPFFQGLRSATTLNTSQEPRSTELGGGWPIKTDFAHPAPSAPTLPIYVMLGGPGSGKGTNSTQLSEEFNFAHLSTGELLRREVAAGTHIGAQIHSLLSSGGLVCDATVVLILKQACRKVDQRRHKGILIDGFPRTIAQAKLLEQEIGTPNLVMYFDAPDYVLSQRLKDRGRFDDVCAVAIENRLKLHKKEVPAVLQHFGSGAVAAPRLITQCARSDPATVYAATRRHFVQHPSVAITRKVDTRPSGIRQQQAHVPTATTRKIYHVPAFWRSKKLPSRPLLLSYIHTQGASLIARRLADSLMRFH
ncbi:adenylate kinase [Thoreauomyces humboldtii]|nr:adenylate kinase [Thoreauomyces humboldtii]